MGILFFVLDSWKTNCVWFGKLLFGIPPESGSANSLRSLPLCCSPVVVLSELVMNLSQIVVYKNFFMFPEWRTAFSDFSQILVTANCPLFAGGSLPPVQRMPCPFVPSGHFPTLWGITLAELSQLDRSRLRRAILRCCCMIADIFMAQNFAAL